MTSSVIDNQNVLLAFAKGGRGLVVSNMVTLRGIVPGISDFDLLPGL